MSELTPKTKVMKLTSRSVDPNAGEVETILVRIEDPPPEHFQIRRLVVRFEDETIREK